MTRLAFDISLTQGAFRLNAVHDGDFAGVTAVFGPSGAGKSSLLRVIAGLERAAQGSVTLGQDVLQDSAARRFVAVHKRAISIVFQQPRLFPHLDVAGNLDFAVRRAVGVNGPDFDAVVSALDLAPLLTRPTGALSGGEQQRVAIARALLSRPRLMLMDEPLSGLDQRRKAQILPYIARLPDMFDLPVIYVTHAVDELTRIADKMIALQDGQIVASGRLAEVFPRLDIDAGGSHFEAGAILHGQLVGHDDALHLSHVNVEGHALVMPKVPLAQGDTVQLRVRARDVMLATVRPEGLSAQNIVPVTVTDVLEEPDTAFAELFLTLGGQVLRARITRAAVAQLGLAVGGQAFAVLKAISFDKRGF